MIYNLKYDEKQERTLAAIITSLLLCLLILIAFYIQFITPIPPFEASGKDGIEVNFGFDQVGMGNQFSDAPFNPDNSKPDPKNNTASGTQDEPSLTADDPSNPPVKNNPKPNPVKDNTPKPDKSLSDAFSNFSNDNPKNPNSDGTGNQGGNQGDPKGNDSPNYDGTGGGGKGYKWDLKGRSMKNAPARIKDFDEEGIIVVEIVVDKMGNVTEAEVNRGKSVNPNYMLCVKARQAALMVKFSPSTDGTLEQKGSITFVFSLQ